MLKPSLIFPFLFVILIFSQPAIANGISVSQSLDKTETAFEDSVRMTITLSWSGAQSAYLFPRPLQPIIDKLKIHQFTSSISSTGQGDNETTTKKYIYTLIPTSSGLGRIEPITIDYVTWPDSIPGELVTEPLTVLIQDPVPVEADTGEINIMVLVIVIVLAAGIITFVLYAFCGHEYHCWLRLP